VNAAQLYVVGRTTSDPDFWGNQDVVYDGLSPFANGGRVSSQDVRRVDVQLFRFGITISGDQTDRIMSIDAPVAGQQVAPGTTNPASLARYFGFYTSATQTNPSTVAARFDLTTGAAASVQTGSIHVIPVPTPATMALLGLGGMVIGRRRRA
jgi:hypothetical protein